MKSDRSKDPKDWRHGIRCPRKGNGLLVADDLNWSGEMYDKARAMLKLLLKGRSGVFSEYYMQNHWRGKSRSGRGSDPDQTRIIVKEITDLLRDQDVKSVLDIPCGDFTWMKKVDMRNVVYIGADVVEELIRENNAKYGSNQKSFVQADIIVDKMPNVDLIVSRDCLVHLDSRSGVAALRNILASSSRFLLTTTFPNISINRDIVTGQWRPINMCEPPYSLPLPFLLINEGCTEGDGQYADKSLGLWRLDDMRRTWANK